MATHVADKHNTGKCGVHVTIDQARGAWAQQIDREERAAEMARRRRALIRMGIRCPRCDDAVTGSKCSSCGFNNISLPEIPDDTSSMAAFSSKSSVRSNGGNSCTSTQRSAERRDLKDRLEHLQSMLVEERDGRKQLEEQIKSIRSLVEKLQ